MQTIAFLANVQGCKIEIQTIVTLYIYIIYQKIIYEKINSCSCQTQVRGPETATVDDTATAGPFELLASSLAWWPQPAPTTCMIYIYIYM